ncbi:ubiquitin--protein ligase molybdopterin-converting factor [Lichtheimia corymbifera JMRC:FSU:9682]|uniref:Ubiquitin--protein ligase molybdopterin-converting factor n=1 Tax=Lichtheimia corymbifera JMRC:FSU:9682 TaxID=1263082 RepID=A0A068RKJ2_9FUNG|nr:ubiquitin--protein ligase molybdopterin-converting factor [Lichtheimia corymbifera JMRC:FSU:9682]
MSTLTDRLGDSLSRFIEKHDKATRLTLTAVAASALTATGILTYQATRRRLQSHSVLHGGRRRSSLHSRIPATLTLTEKQIQEQLHETTAFLGQERMDKLRNSFVIIVGAGGVGSWAALMLLRAGVGRIRIIDFDQVTLSSLNRHAVAVLEDVGTPKVTAIKKHFKRIAPFVTVESCIDLFNAETADTLLSGSPDYVVDAIDNIDTKLDLIKYCYDRNITLLSSMGAGAKADPSRIQVADISETLEDPLARSVRRKLKKMGIEKGVPVVYSTEKPHHVKLLPLEEERVEEADDYAALPEFRSRILPVLGTLPSIFGMTIASYVILKLTDYPNFDPLAIKLRDGLYIRMHRDLLSRESKKYKSRTCPLDPHDVGYIFEEMWHGKSIISGPNDRLALTRWIASQPLSYYNTVCMTREEVKAHEKLPADVNLREQYGDAVCDAVEDRFNKERKLRELWDDVF